MALEQPDDPFLAWVNATQPVTPAVIPPEVQNIGAAPIATELAGPAAPAPPELAWPPPEWAAPAAEAQPNLGSSAPPAPMQPGLGVPAQTLDQAVPPEVDAITGAGGLPPPPPTPPMTAETPEPSLGELLAGGARAIGLDARAPDQVPEDYLNQDELGQQYAAMDPMAYELAKAKHEAARLNLTKAAELDAAVKTREQAERNAKAYENSVAEAQRQSAQLQADAAELAKDKVDSSRWWGSRSTLQTIAAFGAAIVGGLTQARKGGPNTGLQMIDQAIERDIQEQVTNLQNRRAALGERRGLVAEMFARSGNLYQAAETARIAMYEKTIGALEAERQNYDPRGTAAFQIADSIRGLRAQQAAYLQKHAETAQKDFYERYKLAQKDREIDINEAKTGADISKTQAEAAKLRGALGGAGGGAGLAAVGPLDRAKLAAMHFTTLPPEGLTFKNIKEYSSWLEARSKDNTVSEPERKAAADQKKLLMERTIPGVVNYDEQGHAVPFLIQGDETVSRQLKTKFAATQRIVDILDHAMALRTGWSSDTAKGEEWQRLQSLWGDAVMAAKEAGHLGALAGPDMDVIGRWLGTKDPTELRGVEAAVGQARQNFVDGIRNDMQHLGGLDPRAAGQFDIPNTYAKKGTNSPTQQAIEDTKKSHAGQVPLLTTITGSTNYLTKDAPLEDGPEKRTIDAQAEAAARGDQAAIKYLHDLEGRSEAPAVRLYAQAARARALERLGGKKDDTLLNKLDAKRSQAWPESP